MRILDKAGNEIEKFNPEHGHLKEEKIFKKHHKAIEAVEEVGHYEVAAEYPNGGKDIVWIVDQEAVKAVDAYDEYETIQRFIPYTEKELKEHKLAELKQLLSDTDHVPTKLFENFIETMAIGNVNIGNMIKFFKEVKTEYADVLEARKLAREEINRIESEMATE